MNLSESSITTCRAELDLRRRKQVAANLNKQAVRRAINGPLAKTEGPLTNQTGESVPVATPAFVQALSFDSRLDHGTVGVCFAACHF